VYFLLSLTRALRVCYKITHEISQNNYPQKTKKKKGSRIVKICFYLFIKIRSREEMKFMKNTKRRTSSCFGIYTISKGSKKYFRQKNHTKAEDSLSSVVFSPSPLQLHLSALVEPFEVQAEHSI
jgi:hypothetical protein